MNGFVGDEKEVQISDSGATATRYQVDMSEDLMARLGLSSIFNYENSDSGINNDWGYIFGTAILLIVASFVFAAGAVLLIIRFVALNFYILFSPLMFIGWAFPPLGRHTTEYWRGFLGKAFFAPIYLLFIYFSVSIITALNTNRGLNDFASNSLGNALQNPSGGANAIDRLNSASAFPYFILSIASLIMSLVVAQKLGATGASQAISIGQNMRRGAQNRLKRGAVATGRFAATQTGGRAARYATERTGSGLKAATRNLQELKGDSIAARGVRKLARTNAVERYGYGLGEKMTKAKYGLSHTRDEDAKQRYKTEERANLNREVKLGLDGQKWLDEAEKNNGYIYTENFSGEKTPENISDMTEERKQELHIDLAEKLPENVAKMSKQDFEALPEDLQTQVAPYVSSSLSESIHKSDDLSQEQKDKIKKSQQDAIQKSIEGVLDGQRILFTDKLANLSIKQIETMGADFIKQNAHLFTEGQFTDIKKSNRFSEKQVGDFIGARKTKLKEIIESGDDTMIKDIFRLTEKELDESGEKYKTKARKAVDISKLPGDVLAHENALPYLNADVLKAVVGNDRENANVSTENRIKIKENIESALKNTNTPEDKKRLELAQAFIQSPKGQRDFVGQK